MSSSGNRIRFFRNVLLWSVISAAFIGPGTVTTAAKAGFEYGGGLLWVLIFATLACIVLQEAVARVTIVSGKPLGQLIAHRFKHLWSLVIGGSIVFGCAAYEAGNIMGAVAGFQLLGQVDTRILLTAFVMISGGLLWFGRILFVVRLLGWIVALMGLLFIWLAISQLSGPQGSVGDFVPYIPANGSALIIGLLGTTIVPYNLFLGSGISPGQSVGQMRKTLPLAIVLGGGISMAILIVCAGLPGEMSFQSIYSGLDSSGGMLAALFSVGLLAAGISSALTAPLAAALTATSFSKNPTKSKDTGRYRKTWMGVLFVGFVIGMMGYQPIPIILMAQAINGLLLPFLTVVVMILANDARVLTNHANNSLGNFCMGLILWSTLSIGLTNVLDVLSKTMGFNPLDVVWVGIFSLVTTLVIVVMIRSGKRHQANTNEHDELGKTA